MLASSTLHATVQARFQPRFSKAYQNLYMMQAEPNELPVVEFPGRTAIESLRNAGLQLMQMRQYDAALRCFQVSSQKLEILTKLKVCCKS